MTQPTPNGKPFAHYTILGKLGRGGMGVVYKAYEESLGREVALKILPARYAAHPAVVERFQREARTSAKLSHPNITPIYAVGEHDGTHYIAMEYVQGKTLFNHIHENGPLDVSEALHILREAADALREAHRNGILHRDIKPGNIMLDRRKRVKVMDFGLAQVSGETSTLTGDGAKLGTPAYMSPEQCEGKPLDVRTDIYSLGVTLYEMLTKERPFPGDNPQSIMFNITKGAFPDINEKRPGLPQGVRQLLQNMVATDPVNRYESVRSLLEDINRLIENPNYAVAMPGAAAQPSARDVTEKYAPAQPPPLPAGHAPKAPLPSRRMPWFVAGAVALVLFAGVGVATFAYTGFRDTSGAFDQPTPVAEPTIEPAPVAQLDGLIAYFPLDEGQGTTTLDTEGGHRGRLQNATWTQGVRGAGIEFRGGLESYVEVPHSELLSPRDAVTVTAWVNVYAFPRKFASLVFKNGVMPTDRIGDRVYTLWVYQEYDGARGVHLTATPEGASTQVYDTSTRGELPLNEFVHVAGVIDTGAHEMAMYLNGERVAVHDFPFDAIRGGEAPLRLGGLLQAAGSRQTTAGSLAGILDEVRIYNRALASEEIQSDLRLVGQPQTGAGLRTFADAIAEFTPGEGTGRFYDDPEKALGPPDDPKDAEQFVSLGRGGTLTVQFIDNVLTANGDAAADLYIYENGLTDTAETVAVRVSTDGNEWIDVGVTQKEFGGIDLDAYIGQGIAPGQTYRYVKLIDTIGQRNEPKSGADIDAVAAVSAARPQR